MTISFDTGAQLGSDGTTGADLQAAVAEKGMILGAKG